MRVPLSWLREYVSLAEPVDTSEVSRRLTAAGLEVESVESVGHDIRGVDLEERVHFAVREGGPEWR